MVRSMSGYGRGEAAGDGVRVAVEVRSVNHRFRRISVSLPPELAFFEEPARRRVQERVQRGKVEVTATVTGPDGQPAAHINRALAESYVRGLGELATALGIAGELSLSALAALPGVVSVQPAPRLDPERDAAVAGEALERALEQLDRMRRAEGEHLARDLGARLRQIAAGVDQVAAAAAGIPEQYRQRLEARLEALLEGTGERLEPGRLAQEVAFYADRADISEELVRLQSHLERARELLEAGGAVGRSLEFLTQELSRELNTIASKARVIDITGLVVELKSELERVREQVQNLE